MTKTVTGWPVGTIVRGRRVMWEGERTPRRARRCGLGVERWAVDEITQISSILGSGPAQVIGNGTASR